MRRGTPGRAPVPPVPPLVLLVLLVLVAGCSTLPDEGPVRDGGRAATTVEAQPFEYNPPGPRRGAPPDDIVAGFLSAQQAVPVSTRVAEEYLTDEAAQTWRPDRRTIVYGSSRVVADGLTVTVRLRGARVLDSSGRWEGAWSGDGRGTLRMRVDREDQEWRIVDPPPALVIPRSHFESRYEAFSLYFFDLSGSVLVPEPVYLPSGVQAATRLVAGLLEGPPPGGREVERSYLPPGTDLGVGVPIRDGVAEVPLSQPVVDLRAADLSRALAQIAYTLRQLPEVDRFRLLVDGTPIGLPGDEDTVPVNSGDDYSPTVEWAAPDLFGLRGRQVLRVDSASESLVATLPGRVVAQGGRPRSLGVSVAGDRAALVSGDGATAWQITSREGLRIAPRVVGRGTDLARPMWDRTGRLWLVDRTATGSVVRVIGDDERGRLPGAGLDGQRVEAAALSRDGTRLAVVAAPVGAAGSTTPRVRVYRVVRDSLGLPLRLTQERTLSTQYVLRATAGIGWWGPTTLAVMTRPSSFSTRVQLLTVDGASVVAGDTTRLDLLFEPGRSMAVSPTQPGGLVVVTEEGEAHELAADGRWSQIELPVGLRAPAFVG